jgi:hypothetical protein
MFRPRVKCTDFCGQFAAGVAQVKEKVNPETVGHALKFRKKLASV